MNNEPSDDTRPQWMRDRLAAVSQVYAHAMGALLQAEPLIIEEFWIALSPEHWKKRGPSLLDKCAAIAAHAAEEFELFYDASLHSYEELSKLPGTA